MVEQKLTNNNISNLGVGILASEKSRRMRTNKAFLEIEGQSFIQRLCNEFADFGQLYISANNKDTYRNLKFCIVEDRQSGVGPMEGIYQILKTSSFDYNFICSVDMPFLKKELAIILAEYINSSYDCYVLKDSFRLHPTCAIYSKRLTSLIRKLIDKKKYCLLEIFENCKTKYIDYKTTGLDDKMILNINTIEDYEKLCK